MSRIKPKEDDKMSRIPLLQAVAVFVKGGEGKIKTGPAPLPTFFRQDPIPLNRKQPSAAFYFSVQLKAKLDTKESVHIIFLFLIFWSLLLKILGSFCQLFTIKLVLIRNELRSGTTKTNVITLTLIFHIKLL